MTQKIAIVTGASRGIGAATAKLLGERGYAVCVNYFGAKEAAEKIAAALPRAIAVQADMAREDDILRLFETVDKELGPLTALVNNAGINGGRGLLKDTTLHTISHVFATNVFGTMLCCREALKRMPKGSAIVNVSSQAAQGGGFQIASYAASKAAINTFTLSLSREAAEQGVRVNAVSPGIIATDVNAHISEDKLRSIPIGRMGTAEEVAETIAWLLSDAASYVSGSVLPISGAR